MLLYLQAAAQGHQISTAHLTWIFLQCLSDPKHTHEHRKTELLGKDGLTRINNTARSRTSLQINNQIISLIYLLIYGNMSFLQEQLLLAGILIFSCIEVVISSNNGNYMPPNLTHLTDFFPHRPFNQVFSEFFGGGNIRIAGDGSQAELLLNKSTGKSPLCLSENLESLQYLSGAILFYRVWFCF